MAEEPDMVMKRHDTFPSFKTTLKVINQETGKEETINLASALKVTALIQPPKPEAAVIEILCTTWGGEEIKKATGANAGKVEVTWAQATLSEAGNWKVEFEIEWPETGGVKRYQTVPNNGYRIIQVVADLGSA